MRIIAAKNWFSNLPTGSNLQFTDFIIDLGTVLVVPSGLVIRAIGSFRNNGAILVGTGLPGSFGVLVGDIVAVSPGGLDIPELGVPDLLASRFRFG